MHHHLPPKHKSVSDPGKFKAANRWGARGGLRWMGTSASSLKEVVHGM